MRLSLVPYAALALLAPVPALAQDRPPTFPTRDAAVTYRVTGGGATSDAGDTLRIAYLAAERKARTDVEPGTWTVVERETNTGLMVMESERRAMRIVLNPATLARYEPGPSATFSRRGTDRVAGLSCTVWDWRVPNGGGTSCITAEGLILRTEVQFANTPTRLEATEVATAPQDPARFRVPDGYDLQDATRPRPRRG